MKSLSGKFRSFYRLIQKIKPGEGDFYILTHIS